MLRILRAVASSLLPLLAGFAAQDSSVAEDQAKGDIAVTVLGLRSDNGNLRFGLYDSAEAFRKGAGYARVRDTCVIARDGTSGGIPLFQCDFRLHDIPYGWYAIMTGHDVDANGRITKWPWSKELKGVSNYDSKLFSRPRFEKAKFEHKGDLSEVEIRVY